MLYVEQFLVMYAATCYLKSVVGSPWSTLVDLRFDAVRAVPGSYVAEPAVPRQPFLPVVRQSFLPACCLKDFVTEAELLPHDRCYRNQVVAS